MAKHKKMIVLDKEAHDMHKRHGRFPTARPTEVHKDKSKYNRRVKHKEVYNDGM